jgi:hypothetical protein
MGDLINIERSVVYSSKRENMWAEFLKNTNTTRLSTKGSQSQTHPQREQHVKTKPNTSRQAFSDKSNSNNAVESGGMIKASKRRERTKFWAKVPIPLFLQPYYANEKRRE